MTEHTHEYICPYCMAEMTVRHSFADSAMVHKHRKCPACGSNMIHATGNVWNIKYHLEELQKAIADVEKREEAKEE